MLNIIMIIIKVFTAMIFSIFLGGVLYGAYAVILVSFGKKPKKPADWLITNEEYEELINFAENLNNIFKRN